MPPAVRERTVGIVETMKKSLEKKAEILKHARTFGGSLTDIECMKLTGISRNTYYKYKKELLADQK